MDSAGNNRYELLFMDDDVSDPLDNIVAKNKKQVRAGAAAGGGSAAAAAGPAKATSNKQSGDAAAAKAKKSNQAEKENNKPGANSNNKLDGGNKKLGGPNAAAGDKFKQQQQGGAQAIRKRIGGPNQERDGAVGQGQQRERNPNFRQQNGEMRERNNNNRRFPRENGFQAGGENGGGQQRQLRDNRDNRNGPPRYQRNFENGNRTGKREFDRQSGSDKTGVKAVEKRDGAGAHNWGSVKETIDDVNKSDVEQGNAAEKADDSGSDPVDVAPVEEETKELTLDEWKAQKGQRVKPTFNIRKAGEGEDTSQWKKMVALNNTKKKENESEEELEFDPAMYPQRVGRQQRVLDIQFNFNDGRRGGGFGGRGRGRGSRPGGAPGTERPMGRGEGPREGGREGGFYQSRGGPSGAIPRGGAVGKRNYGGDKQPNAAPKVNDERQFPTLA